MAAIKIDETKSLKELNKARKEQRKRWKEEKLLKKAKKAELKNEDTPVEPQIKRNSKSTLSIAVAGSILDNAQSNELRAYLAGQIARAACVFQVDEIIVFDDYENPTSKKTTIEEADGSRTLSHCCVQLGRILQYLECPQYLRKYLFPIHNDLKYAGILNPLDAPHHLRQNDDFKYREGVVTNKPIKAGKGSQVNVGLLQDVHIDKVLTPGLRCTVELLPHVEKCKKVKGIVVSPDSPRAATGVYWGYTVRLATSLSQVFSQCPYKKGYDLTIGTSDKGSPVDDFNCPKYDHLLIVFGGVQGLESVVEAEEILNIDDPRLLFDHYLNTLPEQGSRTIRTEEAILVSLAALRPILNPKHKPITFMSDEWKVIISNN